VTRRPPEEYREAVGATSANHLFELGFAAGASNQARWRDEVAFLLGWDAGQRARAKATKAFRRDHRVPKKTQARLGPWKFVAGYLVGTWQRHDVETGRTVLILTHQTNAPGGHRVDWFDMGDQEPVAWAGSVEAVKRLADEALGLEVSP
jgi:hypothetical protein